MNISFAIPIAVMIVGLILYYFIASAKTQEVGRLMFFAGMFVAMLKFAGSASLHIGG